MIVNNNHHNITLIEYKNKYFYQKKKSGKQNAPYAMNIQIFPILPYIIVGKTLRIDIKPTQSRKYMGTRTC